ncbi:MAG: hemolysin family protein [Planctomycetaceae bacterium]|jgi:CBS domain containing-hemolysin-like protein|nr:hemolysin family protein [Planctomycetaceae bacterium]
MNLIYIILLGLVLICIVSIGSRSLKSFSRHQLEDFCWRRGAETRLSRILKEYDHVAAAAGMLRILLATALITAIVFEWNPKREVVTDWIILILVASLTLLCVEFWLPRAVSKLWGTSFVYFTWPLWSFLAMPLFPLTLMDRFFNVFFHRLAGKTEETDDEEAFEDEIRTMVTEGHREGLLEEDAREMIEGVIELSDFTVSEIMTPRTDMKSISNALSWDEMLAAVIATPHSRIPVYKDNRDDIIGVIHAKDLLQELVKNDPSQRCAWTELMTEPLFVPETKPVDTLLQEFQNTKPAGSGKNIADKTGSDQTVSGKSSADDDTSQRAKGHLAIVLDEYGGVSGVVTLEDILEEIVGEIVDEHDPMVVTEEIKELDAETFEVLGKVRIDELNETLGLDLPEEEDYDTIAGFIFSTLGHVPSVGETVDFEHEGKLSRFTVIEATRRRIEKIRIKLHRDN